MIKKCFLVPIIVVGLLTTGVNARNNCIDPYSIGEYQHCEAIAEGGGKGSGMRMFWNKQTYSIVQMTPEEYFQNCMRALDDAQMADGNYNTKFKAMFINACLGTVGLKL